MLMTLEQGRFCGELGSHNNQPSAGGMPHLERHLGLWKTTRLRALGEGISHPPPGPVFPVVSGTGSTNVVGRRVDCRRVEIDMVNPYGPV